MPCIDEQIMNSAHSVKKTVAFHQSCTFAIGQAHLTFTDYLHFFGNAAEEHKLEYSSIVRSSSDLLTRDSPNS